MLEEVAERYKLLNIKHKAIILLVFFVLFGYLSWSSVEIAEADLESAKNENQELETKIQELSNSGQNLVAVEAKRRKAEQDLSALMELLPEDVEIEEVLAILSAAARDTGVIINKFEPMNPDDPVGKAQAPSLALGNPSQPPPPGGGMGISPSGGDTTQEVSFKISINGTYAQMTSFFDRVLSTPRIIRLTDFNYKVDPAAGTPRTPAGETPAPASPAAPSLLVSSDQSPVLKSDATLAAYIQAPGQSMAAIPPLGVPPPPPAAAPPPPAPPMDDGSGMPPVSQTTNPARRL